METPIILPKKSLACGPVIVFILTSFCIVGLGGALYCLQVAAIESRVCNELSAVADLKRPADAVDYREAEALAAFRLIPGFPRAMAAKIDKNEILAPIRKLFAIYLCFALSLIACAGLLIGLFHRRMRLRHFRLLHEAEERFRSLSLRNEAILNTVPDIIAEVDMNKAYTWMNQAGRRFFGEGVIGKEAANFFEGEQDTYAKVRPLFEGNAAVFYVESWQRRFDGEKRLLAWWCQALKDSGGTVTGALSTARDITEIKQFEERVMDERERLLVTLRSIGDGVITTDTAGTISLMNRVAEELTGWSAEEGAGRPLGEVFHIINEHSRMRCENPVEKVLATGGVVGLANSTTLMRKDGREIFIADSGAPIRDNKSKIIGVVLVFRDVTEKRRADEALRTTKHLESLGTLAGGIAHDFNNLLGGVFGFIDLALSESRDTRVTGYLAKAITAMDRARALTRQLLTFAKGGAPARTAGPLFPFVEDTARFALSGSNVSLACEAPPDLWPCEFDKNQIGQVIDNIIINGQQAMPGGGVISIKAENVILKGASAETLNEGPYVKISIRDSGIGIPKEILSRIFDPFFTTKQKGSGLGLPTSHSIVARHEGRIDVDSEPGKGSAFYLYLPAANKDAILQPPEEADTAPCTHRGRGTVIVLDDEEVMRDTLSTMLKSLGYEVVCLTDGAEVVRVFSESINQGKRFAALVLDLTVPGGMGGVATASAIRKIDDSVPLFVASGYAEDPVLIHPRDYGFVASIRKPFIKSELAAFLEKNLGSRPGPI